MGRGTISGGGTDGLYTLQLDYGSGIRDARIIVGDLKIARLNIEIAEAADKIVLAEARTAEAAAVLQTVLDAIVAAQLAGDNELVAALKPSADKATEQYAQVLAAEAAYRVPRDLKIAERKELVATKGRLQSALIEETQQVWCVDLTEDASGEVATIEIPGEDRTILIAPGGRAPIESDGRLVAREVMSPEQAFFNAAILPGWQKFMPTYRKATITFLDKDTDTATVSLDAATSSAAGLNINQSTTLAGIPVDYMECNAVAFEVGDRVVIGFDGMNWESPKVIGFVESPKPCTWVLTPASNDTDSNAMLLCMVPSIVDQMLASGAFTARLNRGDLNVLGQLYDDREEAGYMGVSARVDIERTVGVYFYKPASGGAVYATQNRVARVVVTNETPMVDYLGNPYIFYEYEEDIFVAYIILSGVPPSIVAAVPFFDGSYPGGRAALANGFFNVAVSYISPSSTAEQPPGYFYGMKNIAEVVCRVGAEKVLHFAFTDSGFLGGPEQGVVKHKGVPGREFPTSSLDFQKLTDYVLHPD